MSGLNYCLERWRKELRELFGAASRILHLEKAKSWEGHFHGEISKGDIHYSIFIVVLSLLPAAVAARVSAEPQWEVMRDFFAAPVQVIINGFLMASLFFLGSHVQRKPKPFPVAYKLMLRVMSAQPILGFFLLSHWGSVAILAVYGFFTVVGAVRTYGIPLRNALLFFGMIYFIFTLMQFQAALKALSG